MTKPMVHTPTHAGAIVFREGDPDLLFLVVSTLDRSDWVLPKGHIADKESPEATALRELREEAGIIGEIVAPLSRYGFKKPTEDVVVQYYLVRHVEEVEEHEQRSIQWISEEAALRLLSFEDARNVLRKGAEIARRHSGLSGE